MSTPPSQGVVACTPRPENPKWLPKGMDPNSACRVVINVVAYVEYMDNGSQDYHVSSVIKWVVDKDVTCWIDFMKDLDDETIREALNQYWDVRKLTVQVTVSEGGMPCTQIVSCVEEASTVVPLSVILPTQESQAKNVPTKKHRKAKDKGSDHAIPNPNPWGEFDEVEYVGVSDEKENYNDLVSDDEANDPEYTPEDDGDEENDEPVDDLEVNDNRGCESLIHITDVENPRIEVGVTFEDGLCFKRCMRQYDVLKEVELAVPYSEATRYRAYCKAKRCRWRIHASRLLDGQTWQIKKMPYKHRNLNYNHHKSQPFVGEVSGVNSDLTTWRHTVDLTKQECSCMEWQLTGLPCRHAISFIGSLREVQLENYVSPYYFVEMFKTAYSKTVPPMPDKSLWEKKTCNEPVYDPDASPPAPPKPKRVRKKKNNPEHVPNADNTTIPAAAELGDLDVAAGDQAVVGGVEAVAGAVQALASDQPSGSPGPVTRSKSALLHSSPVHSSPLKANKKKIANKL
ncbi:hypothetical protein OsJ_28815 [Oryza sativa Japonica Group]|uniref:SWIM-type domain-containing protein n=1 Tax=Oryza sativa subsp. japonica TaxID=39947 RepID=B9G2T3_ORYSJ|nr:hypothetical protein OsJ_28815 [Oryza sativa Japonica Group]